MASPRLITIGVSHFCEKARWALDRAGIAFVEDARAPLFHLLSTRPAGGKSTPLLVVGDERITDSTDILKWVDRKLPNELRLFADAASRAEVESLEERFDRTLGPATRRIAYFHLLGQPGTAARIASTAKPAERATFRAIFPVVRTLMRKGMRIDRAGVDKDTGRLAELLADVESRLSDGRRFLVGDRFSAADLTFAALLAPLVAPPEYGGDGSVLELAPLELRRLIEEMSARPAGAFALRMFREHRKERVAGGD